MAHAYAEISSKMKLDFAYVMNLGRLDKVLPMVGSPFGDTPFGGWVTGVKFHLTACGVEGPSRPIYRLYSILFRKMLRLKTLTTVMVPDELLPSCVGRWKIAERKKVTSIIDVQRRGSQTANTLGARTALGIADQGFVILAYGSIAERKGITQLLSAVNLLPPEYRITVLLAWCPNGGYQGNVGPA